MLLVRGIHSRMFCRAMAEFPLRRSCAGCVKMLCRRGKPGVGKASGTLFAPSTTHCDGVGTNVVVTCGSLPRDLRVTFPCRGSARRSSSRRSWNESARACRLS